MKKILALVLVCIMALTLFSGCKSEKELIMGTWASTSDIASQINSKIATEGALKDALSLDAFEITTLWKFRNDGYYETMVDETALKASKETAKQNMKNKLKSLLGDMDVDSIVNTIFSDDIIASFVDKPVAGKYVVEDNKLYLSKAIDEEPEKDTHIVISVSKSKLTFKKYVGEDVEDLANQSFTRVE